MSAEPSIHLPPGIEPSPPCLFVDASGACPDVDFRIYDICLTSSVDPPRPWVAVPDPVQSRTQLLANAASNPIASRVALKVLRLAEPMDFASRIELESLAYSTLLGGAEFRAWRDANRHSDQQPTAPGSEPVRYSRVGDVVTLTLNDPAGLNAVNTRLRDALADVLDTCIADPTEPEVILRGEGRAFCVGGALHDFGKATDLAQAHLIRTQQSAAARIHRLGERIRVELHGAVIGAGLEMAAAACRVAATPSTWLKLPELSMGLIPGAGGIATLPARIGRHRTAYLLLSGRRIGVAQALEWGLVDEVLT